MTLNNLLEKDLKFIFFGGKGGVGKTSCAAAAAVWYAKNTDLKILIISTDPAHSLADSLDQPIGGEIKPIEGVENLYGLEIDPKTAMKNYKNLMGMSPEESLADMSPVPLDELGMGDMLDTTPPGIDEALAFGKVLEFIEKKDEHDFDLIIFDTAPTGHTLRLLSLPDVLDSFLGKIIKLRYTLGKFVGKLKSLFGKETVEDKTMEALEKLKESIGKAQVDLSDPEKTTFCTVMIPEAMSIYETERLITTLYEYEIPISNVLVNMVYPVIPDCAFCAARRSMQEGNIETIREFYADEFEITEIPLFDTEIRGLERLEMFSSCLFEKNEN
ncbi:MAG: ArsA family ATPase [Promethearchaeota archaeon]